MLTKSFIILALILLVSSNTLFSPRQRNTTNQRINFCNLKIGESNSNPLSFDQHYYFNFIHQRKYGDIDLMSKCKEESSQQEQTQGKQLDVVIVEDKSLDLKQGYKISIDENSVTITVSTYSGYIYALETLYSLIEEKESEKSLPEGELQDSPEVQFRGIMVDSVRHFLSIQSIKRTIQGMSIVRLNMLHWHLTDDEAFTLKLDSHPEMIEGAYDKKSIYTKDQVKEVIQFAKKYGVSIIPQIDTPGHVRSWSQNTPHMGISILCGGGEGYNHQMDLSQDSVWTLTQEIIKQVSELFKDSPYIHLGGDEVFASCWNRQPRIKQWMNNHSISTYGELQMYWRKQIKSAIPDRKVIFWRNDDDNVKIQDDEILHFWGAQKDCYNITYNSNAKIIVSPSDYLYLNSGQGFVTGKPFGHYSTWRQIYQNWLLFPTHVPKERILGTLAALWGEVSNENMLDNNLWPRAAVVASLAWTNEKEKLENFVEGLLKVKKDLEAVGIKVSPFVSEFCENYPHQCKYTDNSAMEQEVELKLTEE